MTVSAATRYHDRLKKKRQAIKIKQGQLRMDDFEYRALLMRTAGVKSSTEINTVDKADAVLDELERLGAPKKPRINPRYPGTPSTLAQEPYLQKIEALLADMELPWAYAEKQKRLRQALADLGQQLATRGLTPQWAQDQAEVMGRLNQPWPWSDCLETLRLIAARLPKRG